MTVSWPKLWKNRLVHKDSRQPKFGSPYKWMAMCYDSVSFRTGVFRRAITYNVNPAESTTVDGDVAVLFAAAVAVACGKYMTSIFPP